MSSNNPVVEASKHISSIHYSSRTENYWNAVYFLKATINFSSLHAALHGFIALIQRIWQLFLQNQNVQH